MTVAGHARRTLLRGGLKQTPRNARRLARAGARTAAPVLPAAVAFARGERDHSTSQVLVPRYLAKPSLGMTTANEQAYFEWYARTLYTGRGSIVDLGCWLGSTTVPLARGLRVNRRTTGVVHAYDRFVWERWMAATSAGSSLHPPPQEGESFQAAFEQRTAPWSDIIVTHQADLSRERWAAGPIEFLLIDAMKSWELCNAIVANFLPAAMVGGFVLQQDFSHYYTPWVHLVSYRLRDSLRPVYDVPRSASALFEVVRPIDAGAVGGQFSRHEVDAAFSWSMDCVAPDKRPAVAAAKVKHLLETEGPEAARAELAPWLARHPAHDDLDHVSALITRAAP